MSSAPRLGRGVNNTAFSPNADITAQLTGSGALPGFSISPTYAATVNLTSIIQKSAFVKVSGSNTTSATVTFTTSCVAQAGAFLTVQTNADSTGTVTATFSTGFRVTGTQATTASTVSLILFQSDGTNWNEIARNTAMT